MPSHTAQENICDVHSRLLSGLLGDAGLSENHYISYFLHPSEI